MGGLRICVVWVGVVVVVVVDDDLGLRDIV
jgi:hypothetical protein